jgi:hypothetical protein
MYLDSLESISSCNLCAELFVLFQRFVLYPLFVLFILKNIVDLLAGCMAIHSSDTLGLLGFCHAFTAMERCRIRALLSVRMNHNRHRGIMTTAAPQ